MIRKLVVMLLVGVMCLVGVTSVLAVKTGPVVTWEGMKILPLPEKYNEAPMLKEKVAAGILPPVEQRLPEEPLVIKPIKEIGQYGGTLYVTSAGPGASWDLMNGMVEQYWFQTDDHYAKVLPDMAKSYEFSEDKKTLTIHFRKGMRWSDGAPFTADDIMFWWEDENLNKELYPGGPSGWWKVGTQFTKFEKLDDYTIRLHFAEPFPSVLDIICGYSQNHSYDPKHYLTKWHIKYNPNANELAKEEGFDHWWEAFAKHGTSSWMKGMDNVDVPVVWPWKLETHTTSMQVWVRNPYFHAVDTAGNQLPYIDRVVVIMCGNREIVNMKTIAGELSYSTQMLTMDNYSLYQGSAAENDYRVLTWKSPNAAAVGFSPNVNHPDPILRKIFQDVRFRQALSLSINRDEINEIVCYGLGVPYQATCDPANSYFKEEWSKAYAQYEPERASMILDEMDLKWDVNHQYRLRSDGKTLSITIERVEEAVDLRVCELTKEYWEKIGVKVNLKTVGRSLYNQRWWANQLDIQTWGLGYGSELRVYRADNPLLNPIKYGAVKWDEWRVSEGKKGEEPPEKYKKQLERIQKWITTTDEGEYKRLAQEIFEFISQQLNTIGTVGYGPQPVVVKNNLGNIPEEGFTNRPKSKLPIQWFFKK